MLSVRYELVDDLTAEEPVEVRERRGSLDFRLCNGLFVPEGVAALNAAARQILAGEQWFQLWKGEVVGMNSPEIGGCHARVHRGPLVDQAPGPRHR